MKLFWIFVGVILLSLPVLASPPPHQAKVDNYGPYQIIEVSFSSKDTVRYGEASSVKNKSDTVIILLNTQTGETWRYFPNIVETSGTGTDTDIWIPIEKLTKQENIEMLYKAQQNRKKVNQ